MLSSTFLKIVQIRLVLDTSIQYTNTSLLVLHKSISSTLLCQIGITPPTAPLAQTRYRPELCNLTRLNSQNFWVNPTKPHKNPTVYLRIGSFLLLHHPKLVVGGFRCSFSSCPVTLLFMSYVVLFPTHVRWTCYHAWYHQKISLSLPVQQAQCPLHRHHIQISAQFRIALTSKNTRFSSVLNQKMDKLYMVKFEILQVHSCGQILHICGLTSNHNTMRYWAVLQGIKRSRHCPIWISCLSLPASTSIRRPSLCSLKSLACFSVIACHIWRTSVRSNTIWVLQKPTFYMVQLCSKDIDQTKQV